MGFAETGDPFQVNRYMYANNDPINMLDTNGEDAVGALEALGRFWGRNILAGAASQADSPAPGPADAAAIGAIAVSAVILYNDLVQELSSDAYTTPGGREVAHGKNSEGYLEGKGWTPEEVDELLDNPAESYGSKKNHRTGEDQTTHVNEAGDWATVSESGKVTQVNEKGNERQPKPEPCEEE